MNSEWLDYYHSWYLLDLSEFSSYKTEEVENIVTKYINRLKKTEKLYGICIMSKIHEILKEKNIDYEGNLNIIWYKFLIFMTKGQKDKKIM